MMLFLLLAIALGFYVIERRWPAENLPAVEGWWFRLVFVNAVQLGIVLLAGITWDRGLQGASIFHLSDHLSVGAQAIVAYLVSTFVYYWWHRVRHESKLFWRLCHQLHHSPRRIELVTSFYKHPVEITLNSLISALLVYSLLGCSPAAAAAYTVLIAVAEYFYHWNIRTPRWLGWWIQRPEAHRIHHQTRHHTQNFADLPIWDWLFGTLQNPATGTQTACGYEDWREGRFSDMLGFRDVHAPGAQERPPLALLPTCLGCSKRWKCASAATETPTRQSTR